MLNLKAQGVPCLTPPLLVCCLSIRAMSSVDLRRSPFDVKLIRWNPIENKICGTVTPLIENQIGNGFLLFRQRCWSVPSTQVGIIKYHRSYYYLLSGHTHSNLIVTALKVFLLLWLPRECIDSVQTINPMKGEDKISSIYHNPKRMPVTCSSSEPSSIWTTTTNAVKKLNRLVKLRATCGLLPLRVSDRFDSLQAGLRKEVYGEVVKRAVWCEWSPFSKSVLFGHHGGGNDTVESA